MLPSLALKASTFASLQPKLTPQEKLKLRMQKALNRQCKQSNHPPVTPSLICPTAPASPLLSLSPHSS